jgi:hypothetical protein
MYTKKPVSSQFVWDQFDHKETGLKPISRCFRQIAKKQLLTSSCLSACLFVLSVCPPVRPFAWNNSAPNGRIFVKINSCVFFENVLKNFMLLKNLTKMPGTLHEYLCTL